MSHTVAISCLDMSLSPVPAGTVPAASHVEHARLFGVLVPVVLVPGTFRVLSGHYSVMVARAAGLDSVPTVDASAALASDRPVESALAVDRIRSAGTDGARVALMALARDSEGATPAGIAERTTYSVSHVQNLLRTWDALAPECRAAFVRGALGTKAAIRLAAMPQAAQVSDDAYLATTAEHAARVKRERDAARLRAKLDALTVSATPAAPAAPAAPVAPLATEHARAVRSVLESTLASLPTLTGADAARARGIVDALAFALGDVSAIPAVVAPAARTRKRSA